MEQVKPKFGRIEPLPVGRREYGTTGAHGDMTSMKSVASPGGLAPHEQLALQELYSQFFGESGIFTPAGQIQLPESDASQSRQSDHADQPVIGRLMNGEISAATAEAQIEPYGKAMMLLVRAMLHQLTGDQERSQIVLSEVQQICGELAGASATAGEDPADKPEDPGLTPREIEVLQIVAEGCTDTEVGQRLFISPRTVSQHLSSIYSKLSVHSRGLAIRYAVENGLV